MIQIYPVCLLRIWSERFQIARPVNHSCTVLYLIADDVFWGLESFRDPAVFSSTQIVLLTREARSLVKDH
jgi:hypothetical protein